MRNFDFSDDTQCFICFETYLSGTEFSENFVQNNCKFSLLEILIKNRLL